MTNPERPTSRTRAAFAANPYAPSQHLGESQTRSADQWIAAWRMYLIVHAMAVAFSMTWMLIAYSFSDSLDRSAPAVSAFAYLMLFFVYLAALMALISPMVVIILLVTAMRRGWKFATAALAEGILTIAFWWASLPAVQ